MLHPKSNRLDYGEQLTPPEGYKLDHAIGTTYSLDLQALLILPVALFYSQLLDGDPSQLRVDMLDAVTKSAEKIQVYCQKGQIKVPNKYHFLCAFWEKSVTEIQMPTHVQSFHPKVWIIRFTHESLPPMYRVIVTSRNLTFARNWDMAWSSEGAVSDGNFSNNQPLIDFLSYLQSIDSKIPENFFRELLTVRFHGDLGVFDRLKFHPIGVLDHKQKKYQQPCLSAKSWDEILVISPFVDVSTLKLISSLSKKKTLLSRKEELDAIPPKELDGINVYQFSSLVEESELIDEGNDSEDLEPMIQGLHAKLFVTEAEEKVHWFLGSANCTEPALGRNIEFLVELRGPKANGLRPRHVVKQLTNQENPKDPMLFEPYDPSKRTDQSEIKRLEAALRKIKFDLTGLTVSGNVLEIENASSYNLILHIDASDLVLPDQFSVYVRPLCAENDETIELEAGKLNVIDEFKGYPETKLSAYVEFQVWHGNTRQLCFLQQMEIELPDSRLNKIFSAIINSREKFLKYLAFLLTGEETTFIDDSDDKKRAKTGTDTSGFCFDQFPVFEKLLIAASRYPDKLDAVNKLIVKLQAETSENGEVIISEEFLSFWQLFSNYHQNLSHAG